MCQDWEDPMSFNSPHKSLSSLRASRETVCLKVNVGLSGLSISSAGIHFPGNEPAFLYIIGTGHGSIWRQFKKERDKGTAMDGVSLVINVTQTASLGQST
jgi:hypothetical protein